MITLERVEQGAFARNCDPAVRGAAPHSVWLNRGKESMAINLESEQGLDLALRLVATADVFLDNVVPSAVEGLCLGVEEFAEQHPLLAAAVILAYGIGGPLCDRKASDLLVQAESGLISVAGTPETATKTGTPASDIATTLFAREAVLAALLQCERTVAGNVDAAMLDATVESLGPQMYVEMCGDELVPRVGLSAASIALHDADPTADGQILIGVPNGRSRQALVRDVCGRPDLVDYPYLATNPLRVAQRHECDDPVAEQTRRSTTAELDVLLAAADAPAAQLHDVSRLLARPRLAERDRWCAVDTRPVAGIHPADDLPRRRASDEVVPSLGAHTDTVLAEFGLNAPTIDRLAPGVVGRPTERPARTA